MGLEKARKKIKVVVSKRFSWCLPPDLNPDLLRCWRLTMPYLTFILSMRAKASRHNTLTRIQLRGATVCWSKLSERYVVNCRSVLGLNLGIRDRRLASSKKTSRAVLKTPAEKVCVSDIWLQPWLIWRFTPTSSKAAKRNFHLQESADAAWRHWEKHVHWRMGRLWASLPACYDS